jgi:hypothetical protein
VISVVCASSDLPRDGTPDVLTQNTDNWRAGGATNGMRDAEWADSLSMARLPHIGRTRKTDFRGVVKALLSITSTGLLLRQLPNEFPPHSTVEGHFYE